ncbi:hydroxyisourate hydrolase [Rhodobaculum claviforme]|uniref:5-hydroxyisourate hydrolase n=1 Tax=Rhodobaculum claviforme TaxID=1549854 RepID=A0A934WHW9_9RHOB|nr:hydroxyisourate hydrolase [Rhodobaculum claviforme]MBK5926236.1 hydroxyisourate hydrolase [Rhodobaculum claviforme]
MTTGRLTTHVLDTARGLPAAGLRLTLTRIEGDTRVPLACVVTNADGRTDAPLLAPGAMQPGQYELTFEAGAYLRATGQVPAEPAFLDLIPVRFGIADAQAHIHVPLLLAAHGYSTYRGS